MTTQILLSLFTVAASVTAQTPWVVGQTVHISSGSVQGHAATHSADVSEYLGIPFAEPPIGNLRFAPPAPITASSQIINGTDFGLSCFGSQIYPVSTNTTILTPQGREIFNEWNQVGDKFGEDCLTLNVWTKPQVGETRKAVLVWLYGGGFFTGSTSVPLYNGRVFADEQDVVLVTVNYRLNMFGFPGSPATQQNLGLLDARAALEWVSQNIAAFGGDPTRIVVFGQSAGAVAADMLLYACPQDPIASGVILQSGSAAPFAFMGETNTTGAAALWSQTAAQVRCAASDEAAALACMRAKPAEELLLVAGVFLPTTDNMTVFNDYPTRKNFARVPILIGINDNELGILQALDAVNMGANTTGMTPQATISQDATFACPIAQRANFAVENNVPVWRYRWSGSFPNTQLLTGVNSGAWHGSELGVLFGTNQAVVANTPEENALGTFLRWMWALFAKDPANGLSSIVSGVPKYSPTGNTLIRVV